ncbi:MULTISPECIES: AraC family transcriptional regulator [Pantoea]|uniref:AraC family transcriptional regulator n=1 Tax=Pantoea TaxID=53335 RepID=UPI000A249A94|nr:MULTISPECIES: AraC family transcriptional regulator [Pantoea]KAA6045555.1 AraC family transcriptional regulator [Pantoea sp. Bo_7]KAA6090903.1 AraC family transcriptional regulator [Pantoea sp. Bo_10]NIE71817.1 AraC family transcriptional regulator [Pantoea sp. Acro-807]ORM78698.1 AraC family transcriptional regulator [Pantoea eucrina]RBO12426.1 AraC family transcriptional regulator [Pantoea sp. 3_1284]
MSRYEDLTSELLMGMRLYGVKYQRIALHAPFGLQYDDAPGRAQLHFVGRGTLLLRAASGTIYPLQAGDALLIPHGKAHALISDETAHCEPITTFNSKPICPSVCAINDAADADLCPADSDVILFSACMAFELGGMQPLVHTMPDVMLVSTLLGQYPEIQPILDAMERETRQRKAGFAGILSRLADVVAAQIVRGWVENGCGAGSGLVQALRDPRLSLAMAAMHRAPGENWTVERLARASGSSRSVFAARFQNATGMTPLRYLTELRMRLAKERIVDQGEAVESVAFELGYGSLAAFSRAFKRITGTSPGALRAGREVA